MRRLLILKLTIFLSLFATEAHAYIDPGTGSMIIQMLIGAFAATYLFFKSFWSRIKSFFSRSTTDTVSKETVDGKDDDER